MKPTEAAAFALVLGFLCGILMLAGLVMRPDHRTESPPQGDADPAASTQNATDESGPHFAVRVRDVNGEAIAGAKVRLASRNGRGAASNERRTDERGEIVFASLTQDEYELRVTQTGFATLKRTVAPVNEAARSGHVDVMLRGADRTLTGRVVDADGTGVQGLRLVASAPDPENATSLAYQASSTAGGAFEIRGVPDVLYELDVAPDQAEQFRVTQPVSARPDGGDVVLRLARRASLEQGGAGGGGTRVTGWCAPRAADLSPRWTCSSPRSRMPASRTAAGGAGCAA
jgi:hypothetical protein